MIECQYTSVTDLVDVRQKYSLIHLFPSSMLEVIVNAVATRNLAIDNKSRENMQIQYVDGIIVTPWPWNVGYGSLNVIENGTIR